MRRRLALAIVAVPGLSGLASLAGCGFQLRRPPPMPFRRIALAGFAPRSPMAQALREALGEVAEVVPAPERAEVVLVAIQDVRERSIVASTANAQVRELQLRLRFGFRVLAPGGRELAGPAQLALARDLSTNETVALAKEQEEAQLFREMQADVVTQVLRRLASLPPPRP